MNILPNVFSLLRPCCKFNKPLYLDNIVKNVNKVLSVNKKTIISFKSLKKKKNCRAIIITNKKK